MAIQMYEKKGINGGVMERAPYWYNTPLKDLDFEWSKEELWEIERYCQKILKNIAEEDMTPIDRWNAQWYAKPNDYDNADRKPCYNVTGVVYGTRTLDGYADALVPIDLYHNPKLLVKAKLATVARFKGDVANWLTVQYTESLWGGRARMIDYGNPSLVGDPPVKTMKDLEALEVPDPYKDGLYPGYLWTARELRRFQDMYKIPMPVWPGMCPGAPEVVQLGMMGWTGFQMAAKRNPELAKAASNKAQIWCKRFGRALIKEGKSEAVYCCQFTGGYPLSGGNEWVGDLYAELGQDLHEFAIKTNKHKVPGKPDGWVHLSHGNSYLSGIMDWYKVLWDRGSHNPNNWDGGTGGRGEGPLLEAVNWHRERNIYISISIENVVLEKGPISKIDEDTKAIAEWGGHHRKFLPDIVPVYFCPPAHDDAAVAATKKYNQLSYLKKFKKPLDIIEKPLKWYKW